MVATVRGVKITRAAYDRLVARSEADYAKPRGYPDGEYYHPPDYTRCIRDRRRRGQVDPDATWEWGRRECRTHYEGIRRWALVNLIENEWAFQEGVAHRIKGARTLDGRSDIQSRLTARAVRELDDHISDQVIAGYYREHKEALVRPEYRRWKAVVSDTAPKARRAKRALERGLAWPAVARRYGTARVQRATSARDGVESSLAKPIFSAHKDEAIGPVAGQAGLYVLQVELAVPARSSCPWRRRGGQLRLRCGPTRPGARRDEPR